jgi:hypothetical protein
VLQLILNAQTRSGTIHQLTAGLNRARQMSVAQLGLDERLNVRENCCCIVYSPNQCDPNTTDETFMCKILFSSEAFVRGFVA